MTRAAVALAVLASLVAAPTALAADCPRTTLGDVENEVMCPICGTPLALATEAPQAQRERAYIERLIVDCRSKDEIKQALVTQYGEGVLALPGDEGGDLADALVYAVPALALMLSAGGIALAVARWRGRGAVPTTPPEEEGGAAGGREPRTPVAPSGSARLEADLDRYDL